MSLFTPSLLSPIDRASAVFFSQRSLYYYARGKMGLDPSYPLLARLLQASGRPVLDLGCGPGVFAAYLREHGITAPVLGVDVSPEKIALAQELVASRYESLTFVVGDALEAGKALPCQHTWEGDIVLLDVLHYFPAEKRQELLRNLVGLLPPGGRLFLRNGVREVSGWRYAVTQAEEAWVRSSRWIRGGAWNFPSLREVETELREAGSPAVVSVPLWGRTPFSSYFFVATGWHLKSGL
jgi:SAM-dependent methyltransferase